MEFCLKKKTEDITKADPISLHSFKFINGKSFPLSYINFVEKFGYGLSSSLFLIYIPLKDHPDSYHIRSEEIISTYQDVLDDEGELWFDLGPDLEYDDLKNLIPFAMSENGHYLFWDIESDSKENELDIYITDFRGLEFTKVSHNLYDFFKKLTSEDSFKLILPFSKKAPPKTFSPIKISYNEY